MAVKLPGRSRGVKTTVTSTSENGVKGLRNGKLCIVVADDQPQELALAAEPLRAQGMEVREATNGAEALEMVRAGGVDLVVLDAYMPRVNGFLAVKSIIDSEHEKAPPMLLLIPNLGPKETAMGTKLGARACLPKPVNPRDLVQKVLSLSSARRSETAAGAGPAPVARPAAALNENRVREEIVKRIEQLPSLPAVVHELMEALGDESKRVEDLEAVICRDQALAARILKLVNSSFFRSQREIGTIGEAIMRLGRNTIQSLALASTTSVAFTADTGVYGYVSGGLWLHSFSVAVAARRYSSIQFPGNADKAFLGGLLHDVGKLVLGGMIQKNPTEFRAALAETGFVGAAEKQIYYRDHTDVGDMIGERWRFPPRIREMIKGHHRPINAVASDSMLAAVVLADLTCDRLLLGKPLRAQPPRPVQTIEEAVAEDAARDTAPPGAGLGAAAQRKEVDGCPGYRSGPGADHRKRDPAGGAGL